MNNSSTGNVERAKTEWQNHDNIQYYENIPVEALQDFAIRGGLETGADIDIIYKDIATKASILEFGAAYGRVIKNLLARGYQGTIYALERSVNLCSYLQAQFHDRVEIFCLDLVDFQPPQKVDVVLALWSGISEFPKEQQLLALQKMLSWLNPNGIIILDSLPHTLIPKNVSLTQDQTYVVFSEYGTAYGYTPCIEEIDSYAEQLGIKKVKHINYKTSTGGERILHILNAETSVEC